MTAPADRIKELLALSELATKGELQVREDDPFVIELFLAGTNKLFDLESGANLDLIAAAVNFIRSDAFRQMAEAQTKMRGLEYEAALSERSLDQVLKERDWAQECLQETHLALGGDGEWAAKMPSEMPPESGDLHYDVPYLAREITEKLEASLAECAALRKDAERYRFFRERFKHPGQLHILANALGVEIRHFDPNLDESIDAAVAGEGK